MTKFRLFCLLCVSLLLALPAHAQGGADDLLGRINGLRSSLGLPGYTTNPALAAAAQSHAGWMAATGSVSHFQPDGSGPRDRARAAGYSSPLVSENIYMGGIATVNDAWNFWINSPVHYAGLTSPNYDNIGIGIASGEGGRAFVLVFGGSSGTVNASIRPGSAAAGGGAAPAAGPPPQPSFVVGLDSQGNIMHEVQPGDTIGDIALIYGYGWAEVPYMLEINGLTWDDIRRLQIGSVFLVPPADGTYTPTPDMSTATPTATTPPPTATPTTTPTPDNIVAPATFVLPTQAAVLVRPLPTATPAQVAAVLPTPPTLTEPAAAETPLQRQPWLLVLVALQLVVLVAAGAELLRRMRRRL